MSAQVWRVLTPGDLRYVTVKPDRPAGFVASTAGSNTRSRSISAHYAVVRLAVRLGWEVTEIRGPGEATTAEQLAAATARAQAAEQECARLRAALREYATRCEGANCARLATQEDAAAIAAMCDECASTDRVTEWHQRPHADVLRSLDGVTR